MIDILGEDKVFDNYRDAVEAYAKYCEECDSKVKMVNIENYYIILF